MGPLEPTPRPAVRQGVRHPLPARNSRSFSVPHCPHRPLLTIRRQELWIAIKSAQGRSLGPLDEVGRMGVSFRWIECVD